MVPKNMSFDTADSTQFKKEQKGLVRNNEILKKGYLWMNNK